MSEVRALLLAAGLGTRLWPLNVHCPKCLIPIGGRPLLEYWLCSLYRIGIDSVLVNVHHHRSLVSTFLDRPCFSGWVQSVIEEKLLGTAGTLRQNGEHFIAGPTLLVHADNWCQCDWSQFLEFHRHYRPTNTVMTMMTFRTSTPSDCGIVQIDSQGIVQQFHEKVSDPPGNLANGAVYLLEPEVAHWIIQQPHVSDFSTQVLPEFLGRVATWENVGVHRDIGTIQSLLDAQNDNHPNLCWLDTDEWMRAYYRNPVHELIIDTAEKA